MDYRELFALVHTRPGMYGLDGSFKQFCIFVMGCDAGTSWSLLNGFRKWLATQLGSGYNLAWPALVELLAFPSREQICAPLNDNENTLAVEALFRLLDEFLALPAESKDHADVTKKYP